MSNAAQRLYALAAEEFPDLTEAERTLVCAVAAGDVACYKGRTLAENDPAEADSWGEMRTIRSLVLRWLCVDREALRHVDPRGVRISQAKIDGSLDLRAVTIPYPLLLERCAIPDCVYLNFAEARLLSFTGTMSGPIYADGLVVHGDLWLRHGFRVKGDVNLVRATINGNLDCSGGTFLNLGWNALYADGITVHGDVFLCRDPRHQRFRAEGQVRLVGARVSGDWNCSWGVFHNPGETALNAAGITVHGRVFLNVDFEAEGSVSLVGATIGGELDCAGGSFHRPDFIALNARRANIDGSVSLGMGFQAEGAVLLIGATIGGDLECEGGVFHNPGETALNAAGITVHGRTFLRQGFRAEGQVRLVGATIKGDLDCSGGSFHTPDAVALVAVRAQIGGSTLLHQGFHAEGEVHFAGIEIAGTLIFCDVQSGITFFDLEGARIGRLFDDLRSWHELRAFKLDGLVYTALLGGPTSANARLSGWLERQPHLLFRPQPYQQLAKVLRERGQDADARRVLIAKERARRTRGTLGWWARRWSWFLGITMAYGYQPQRLLLDAVLFILLGWGVFAAGDRAGLMIPTKAEAYTTHYTQNRQVPAFYPSFRPLLYSLDTFLPIINFGQKDYWRPRDGTAAAIGESGSVRLDGTIWRDALALATAWVSSGEALRLYRWLHIGVGWLVITLGIAGVTGVVRKD